MIIIRDLATWHRDAGMYSVAEEAIRYFMRSRHPEHDTGFILMSSKHNTAKLRPQLTEWVMEHVDDVKLLTSCGAVDVIIFKNFAAATLFQLTFS